MDSYTTTRVFVGVILLLAAAMLIWNYIDYIRRDGQDYYWGPNVPAGVGRSLFFVSMVLSAAAMVSIVVFYLFVASGDDTVFGWTLNGNGIYAVGLLILGIVLASVLWFPSVKSYVEERGGRHVITVVLALVAMFSFGLLLATLFTDTAPKHQAWRWAIVACAGYFLFHTAVMDALVWNHLFRKMNLTVSDTTNASKATRATMG